MEFKDFFSNPDSENTVSKFIKEIIFLSSVLEDYSSGKITIVSNSINEFQILNEDIPKIEALLRHPEQLKFKFENWAWMYFNEFSDYHDYIKNLFYAKSIRLRKIENELIQKRVLSFIVKIESSWSGDFPYSSDAPNFWIKIKDWDRLLSYFLYLTAKYSGVLLASSFETDHSTNPNQKAMTYILNFKI